VAPSAAPGPAEPEDAAAVRADPPAQAGDLRAEVEAFTTLASCVERHASLDPLVGDALEAIGYDTLLSDSCRVLEAAKARSSAPCSSIQASPLRDRCSSVVAELNGKPDDCPWRVSSHPALGHDPACLALASGDGRLCAAVSDRNARAQCFAVAGHSPQACSGMAVPVEKARCEREAARWASVIPLADREKKSGPLVVAGRVFVSPPTDHAGGANGPAPIEVDLAGELQTGVVLVRGLDATRLRLGPLNEADDDFIPPSPLSMPQVAFDLEVPSAAVANLHTAAPRLERIQVRVPRHPVVHAPPAASSVVPVVTRLELRRGGAVEISLEGDIQGPGGTWHLRGDAKTFVRDIVTEGASTQELR
jgi:hypothetical protein